MILSMLLLSLQAGPPVEEQQVDEAVANEIVVVREALGRWRGTIKTRAGALVCKQKESTGDTEIDTIRCDAFRWCFAKLQPEIDAIEALDLPRKEAEARLDAAAGEYVIPCVEDYEDRAVEALARERAEA